jgi:hypothetical protein
MNGKFTEKKWSEARQWSQSRITKVKYKMPTRQKPDGVVADSFKRLASRFYQLKTGHGLTGQYLAWARSAPPSSAGGARTEPKHETTCSRSVPRGGDSRRRSGQRSERKLGDGRAAGRSGT